MKQSILLGSIFILGWYLSWIYYDKPVDLVKLTSSTSTIALQAPVDTGHNRTQQIVPKPNKNTQSKPIESVFDTTLERLQRGEYELVMTLYPDIQKTLSNTDAFKHKNIILNYVRTLSFERHNFQAHALLKLFLKQNYDDVQALVLLAHLYQKEGNEVDAIEAMYRANSYAHTSAQLDMTTRAIRTLVKKYNLQLFSRKDYLSQLDLYKRLTELEPDYTLHYIDLANAYLSLGNAIDARKALNLTLHDSSVSNKANEIFRRIENDSRPKQLYAANISLQKIGNQFYVEALLNNSQNAALLLDTGASLSIISRELLANLEVSNQQTNKSGWFSTANGRVQAPIVKLSALSLDKVSIENIEVGVIDVSDNRSFDGLLGMNFLRHFVFFINQDSQTLQLSPR